MRVTHIVKVCGKVVADLLEMREAVDPLQLLSFLFDVTLGGLEALDALVHCPLALDQLGVHLRCCRSLLLHRNTQ